MTDGWLRAALMCGLAAGLVGCSAPGSTPAAETGPGRSYVSLRSLEQVEPCDLLTPAQVRAHQLGPGVPEPTPFTGSGCTWAGRSGTWTARIALPSLSPFAVPAGNQTSRTVNLDGVTVTMSDALDPGVEGRCRVSVEASHRQMLDVHYADRPGTTRFVACRQALTVTRAILENLRYPRSLSR